MSIATDTHQNLCATNTTKREKSEMGNALNYCSMFLDVNEQYINYDAGPYYLSSSCLLLFPAVTLSIPQFYLLFEENEVLFSIGSRE